MSTSKFEKQYKVIGVNLKKQRKKRGLTQLKLADKCGGTPDNSKISDMENGKEDFMISTLLTLCQALDLTLSEVVKETTD